MSNEVSMVVRLKVAWCAQKTQKIHRNIEDNLVSVI